MEASRTKLACLFESATAVIIVREKGTITLDPNVREIIAKALRASHLEELVD